MFNWHMQHTVEFRPVLAPSDGQKLTKKLPTNSLTKLFSYSNSLNFKLEKVALDGSVECCVPPPRWCDLELSVGTIPLSGFVSEIFSAKVATTIIT